MFLKTENANKITFSNWAVILSTAQWTSSESAFQLRCHCKGTRIHLSHMYSFWCFIVPKIIFLVICSWQKLCIFFESLLFFLRYQFFYYENCWAYQHKNFCKFLHADNFATNWSQQKMLVFILTFWGSQVAKKWHFPLKKKHFLVLFWNKFLNFWNLKFFDLLNFCR